MPPRFAACCNWHGGAGVPHLHADQLLQSFCCCLEGPARAACGRGALSAGCGRAAAIAACSSGVRQRGHGKWGDFMQRRSACNMKASEAGVCIGSAQKSNDEMTFIARLSCMLHAHATCGNSMCICALNGHEHCLFAPYHNVATSYLNMLPCKPTLLAVLLTLVATATCAAVNQTNCDRYRSRKAQVVVQDYILPRAKKLAYTLPESCLIHPQRDMCAAHLPPAHMLLLRVHNQGHVVGSRGPMMIALHEGCNHLSVHRLVYPADTRCKRRSVLSCSAVNGSAASAARRCGGRTTWTPTWTKSTRTSLSRQGWENILRCSGLIEYAPHVQGHGVTGKPFSARTLRMQAQC